MIEKSGKLLLVLASLAVSALVVEGSFWLLAQAEPIYPVVFYDNDKTDDPSFVLDCYDDHFVGTPDWDLRQAHPFGELTYRGNAHKDSSLANLSPLKVPNAIEMRRNEKGLRERPMTAFDAERDKIVVVVGDSFCFGLGVRVVDRFSNVLETRLNREYPAERYRLFNTCKQDRNIEQIAEVMEGYVESFARVDRVVYSFVLNDPIFNWRLWKWKRELREFVLNDPTLGKRVEGVTIKEWWSSVLERGFYDSFYFRDFFSFHSRSNAASVRFLAGRDSYTLRWFAARLQRQLISRYSIEWYRRLYIDNPQWPQTQQVLRRMKDYCSAKGIAFSLVVWPLFYQLDAYPLTEVHEFIGAVARQEGIHYVDLLPLFAGKDARDYRVHPTDLHPNSRAHAEAAAFLYDAIPW